MVYEKLPSILFVAGFRWTAIEAFLEGFVKREKSRAR